MKRFVTFACVALLLAFILTQPEVAADAVDSIWSALKEGVGAFTTFLTRLFS